MNDSRRLGGGLSSPPIAVVSSPAKSSNGPTPPLVMEDEREERKLLPHPGILCRPLPSRCRSDRLQSSELGPPRLARNGSSLATIRRRLLFAPPALPPNGSSLEMLPRRLLKSPRRGESPAECFAKEGALPGSHMEQTRSQARSRGVLPLSSAAIAALVASKLPLSDEAAPTSRDKTEPTLPQDAAACSGVSPSQSLSHTARGYACRMTVVDA
mmetsp:Transcript_33296/g.70930  ORF Transcript_33296/g.70930 Transcript_33296/m.70930 type:complete len:213 (-) Transcript_33296:804-1442(-)